jgi:hypothetical protein
MAVAAAPTVPAGSPVVSPAPSTPSIAVSGQVSDGSGASLPAGLTASLHGILNQQETLNLSTPLNPDGTYAFEKVGLTNGMEFLVAVQYGPVSFLSAGAVFDGTKSSYDQPVTIYDSSSDLASLSLSQLHIQASFSTPGEIQLDEIYVLTNPGKTAVTVSTDGTSLPFASLPKGALQPSINLSQGSAPLLMADTGFAMLPGASDFNGSSYQIYSAGALQDGSTLALTFSGSPQAAATGIVSPALLIGLGILGLLLVAAGLILYLRGRRKALATGQAEAIDPEAIDDETARLADTILALDDRFAAGKIDQNAYQQQRAELKEKLKERL